MGDTLIEQLVRQQFELPAFSTLDKLVNHIRQQVHQRLYAQVAANLNAEQKAILDGLLVREKDETRTMFTRLKSLPAKSSLKWIRRWERHLKRLEAILNPQPFIAALPVTKIEQFASQAYQMEISDMVGVTTKTKRYTLLLCFLHQMQVRTRDQLTTMYLKRMRLLHNNAKKRLQQFRDKHRLMNELMIDAFADVVHHTGQTEKLPGDEKDSELGRQVRQIIARIGGAEKLQADCEMLQAYHDNNYLALLPHCYRQHRAEPFRLTKQFSRRWRLSMSIIVSARLICRLIFHSPLPARVGKRSSGRRWMAKSCSRSNSLRYVSSATSHVACATAICMLKVRKHMPTTVPSYCPGQNVRTSYRAIVQR
jgi:hypothetical protein